MTDRTASQPDRADAPSRAAAWFARRSFRAEDFPLARLLAHKRASVSVVIPTREVADTIEPILERLLPLRAAGLVDELFVIDAASADGTAARAHHMGATVVQESDVLAEHGPARGKGDALWRAVAATTGDVVVFVDGDTEDFDPRFVLGLLGPLLTDDGIVYVKGAYRRPFRLGEQTVPDGGGRVNELVARPLLNLHVPDLAGFVQPLAGEVAARRSLLEELSFPVGYGVEIAMLIDALHHSGLDALAQVDLGTRQNHHQSLRALSAMAYAVLVAAQRRIPHRDDLVLEAPGSLVFPHGGLFQAVDVATQERPPLRTCA